MFVRSGQNGLNPCFNGRYSQSDNADLSGTCLVVLILVLMEDTLRDLYDEETMKETRVLILVLMEDTLRDARETALTSYIAQS